MIASLIRFPFAVSKVFNFSMVQRSFECIVHPWCASRDAAAAILFSNGSLGFDIIA